MKTDLKNIPFVNTDQMRKIDELITSRYLIKLIQLMENAGRMLGQLARARFLYNDSRRKKIVVLAGNGGNGGGVLAAARNLHNWGADVTVVLTKQPHEFSQVPGHQLNMIKRLKIITGQPRHVEQIKSCDLILDGIIGYGLEGHPIENAAYLIRWANRMKAPKLSLDVPSGLNCTSGHVNDPCIMAEATMTLALPKIGMKEKSAKAYMGDLYLADIGIPPILLEEIGIELDESIFFDNDLIQLW